LFGVVLDGGRQREEKKTEKTQFVIFYKPHKTPSGRKKKVVSLNVCREFGGNFVNLGWWNRSGNAGPFIIKTWGIVNKMVIDMGFFRSRSRRWPAAGKEKTQLVIFCKHHKTPSESKKKMVWANVCRELGGTFD
jgi:hypothetical protein